MEIQVYLAIVVATATMIALPGPSVLLTVAHRISFGWQHALFTVAGATIGIAVQLVVAAIGLTSLLNVVADAFEWIRWAGVVYLVYLGIKQWRSASEPPEIDTSLPQFIDASRSPGLQFAIIVPTFLVITFTVTSIWALVAGKARGFLHRQHTFKSVMRSAGGLMIIAGVGLAMARRGN